MDVRSSNTFSSIQIDQADEQNNELIKGDGGIIGITENPGALLRWMVAGPELARIVKELDNSFEEESTDLISLVSKDIADPAMKATLNNIESIRKGQYELFIKERLTDRSKPIDDSISRKNLPLWKPGSKSSTSKEKMKLKTGKTDCQLFGSHT